MSEAPSASKAVKGILTDVTKCIGCERCVEACSLKNKMPVDQPFRTDRGDGLSGRRLTAILKIPGTTRTVHKHCLHCNEPSCAAACLVGALVKRPDGPVVYDSSKCIGCRYCMMACPFMIPRYEWDRAVPYIRKCKMNEECRMPGGMPACATACPTGATIFGERKALLKEAWRRIKDKPGLYLPHVYGEHEVGGTSVLYITSKDAPLADVLGFPKNERLQKIALGVLSNESIPELNHPWVRFTPIQAGTVFSGLWIVWLFRRRSLLMNGGPHERGDRGAPEPGTAGIDEVCPLEPSASKDTKEGE